MRATQITQLTEVVEGLRTTSLEIAGVWDSVDLTTAMEAEDLVARVACRLAEHVIPRS
jgi:hypothetical protein